MEEISGVYLISNIINGNCYVGASVHVYKRQREHLNTLKNKCHPSELMQADYDKYGKDSFEFCVIKQCNNNELSKYEKIYINEFYPEYNARIISWEIIEWWKTTDVWWAQRTSGYLDSF